MVSTERSNDINRSSKQNFNYSVSKLAFDHRRPPSSPNYIIFYPIKDYSEKKKKKKNSFAQKYLEKKFENFDDSILIITNCSIVEFQFCIPRIGLRKNSSKHWNLKKFKSFVFSQPLGSTFENVNTPKGVIYHQCFAARDAKAASNSISIWSRELATEKFLPIA